MSISYKPFNLLNKDEVKQAVNLSIKNDYMIDVIFLNLLGVITAKSKNNNPDEDWDKVISRFYLGSERNILFNYNSFYIYKDDELIGFYIVSKHKEGHEDGYMLEHILIDKKYQRKGYGKEVMNKIIKEEDREFMEIYVDYNNPDTLNFYSNWNFKGNKPSKMELVMSKLQKTPLLCLLRAKVK